MPRKLIMIFECRRCRAQVQDDASHTLKMMNECPADQDFYIRVDAFKFCEPCSEIVYPEVAELKRKRAVKS